MNTPNEIATMIASSLGRELDIAFKLQLFDRVKLWRARLIANTLDRNPQDKVHFSQSILVPMVSGDGYSISQGAVPKPLEGSPLYFDYIGDENGKQAFTFAQSGTLAYFSAGRYSRELPIAEIINDRLYINKEGYCKVLVRSIFDDPIQAQICEDPTCDYWNKPYPVSRKVLQQIIQYITQVDYGNRQPASETYIDAPAEERSTPGARGVPGAGPAAAAQVS